MHANVRVEPGINPHVLLCCPASFRFNDMDFGIIKKEITDPIKEQYSFAMNPNFQE